MCPKRWPQFLWCHRDTLWGCIYRDGLTSVWDRTEAYFLSKKIYSGRAIEPLNPLFKTLNSICESRLRAITLICYVGGQGGVKFSTPCMRILGTGTSSFFGIVMLSYHMIWRHSSLHLLTLSFSEKGPDACCLNSKADLKWFSALRFGNRFLT